MLIGGIQGSGKSSVLDYIRDKIGLLIISNDEVRQILFDRGYPFSKDFPNIVKSASVSLIRKAISLGYSIAPDENFTPPRIEKIKLSILEAGYTDYKFLTVFLQLSRDELLSRVQSRTKVFSRYQGTVNELEASFKKHRNIDQSAYDIVIDSSKKSIAEIGKMIIGKIK